MDRTTTLSICPDRFQAQTMASLEMAGLAEKRHDSVKRTIDTLATHGTISRPQIVDGMKSANGVVEQVYLIGKRDSYVVMAQLSPEFTARLVDRWQELEEKAAKPAFVLPNFTNPAAAARAWADAMELSQSLAIQSAQQQTQLAIATPAIAHLKAVQSSKDDYSFQEMANILQEHGYRFGRNRLMNILRRAGVLTKASNMPMQEYRERGYFRVVQSIRKSPSGRTYVDLTTYVTGKGHNWLTKAMDMLLLEAEKLDASK